jgi:hypothetical protein
VKLFILYLLLSPFAEARAGSLGCARSVDSSVSGTRAAGVETIHKQGNTVITILLPMPKGGAALLDLNAMGFNASYPERFTMSDGTLGTAFVEVDTRNRSSLMDCVRGMAEQVREQGSSKDAMLGVLKDFISQYLLEVPEGARFPWDPKKEPKLPAEFQEAADLKPGHYPLKTGIQHPVVPLEAFLKQGRGACLPKVMLTSLVMKELKIPHRVRVGGTDSSGHMWIELPDGRHLDPTWKLLKSPSARGAGPGWFRFDQSYLYENQFFPVAED